MIGDALRTLEKKVGYEQIRINHLGDWELNSENSSKRTNYGEAEELVKADPIAELI